MATKLDKNFGLGNSYKNVKLVKSGIKKSDSNTEKLIEQLKAGTLPVYEMPYNTKVSESGITAPCILILTDSTSKYINLCERFTSNEIGYFYFDTSDTITSFLSSYHENDTFEDVEESPNVYATEYYVNQNKGTKLYKHIISFTFENFSHTVECISTEERSLEDCPQYSSIYLHPLNNPKINVSGPGSSISDGICLEIDSNNYSSLSFGIDFIKNFISQGNTYSKVDRTQPIQNFSDTVTPL